MPVITDLTWDRYNAGFTAIGLDGAIVNARIEPDGTPELMIRIDALVGEKVAIAPAMTSEGVIKAISKMLQAALAAQNQVNESQVVGERLNAFPAPAVGAIANGFAPITRSVIGRHDLTSATNVVGGNV